MNPSDSRPKTILFDPRIQPLVHTLTDEQVAAVLRAMCETWTPDEDPEAITAGSPTNNRSLLVEVAGMNIAMGGEPEYTTLLRFIERVRPSFV